MKILYIPLDERPCNLKYPQAIAQLQPSLTLIAPPKSLLGQKKQPAPPEPLWQWVESAIVECDGAILSIEMLIYGGLLPSRLHHRSAEELLERVDRIRQLKQTKPDLFLLASNLIMRSPSYNSSEEEPDYYADFGQAIFRWGWLTDQQQRQGLTVAETKELTELTHQIPEEYLSDYRNRRGINRTVNQAVIELVKRGTIEFLSIPQDDSAEYGFTAIDQREIYRAIAQQRLQHKIHVYPGADEVGCTLLSHAYVNYCYPEKSPIKIYPLFSSVNSQTIIPLYEDRPLGESLKAHILAAGGCLVNNPKDADLVLAINTAGQVMQESWDQIKKDITYSTCRNLRAFTAEIARLIQQKIPVAIADVAFANGGETELVELLDDKGYLDKIIAYAGWNTNCNTLGTAIASGILSLGSDNTTAIQTNIIQHLLEDWAYQAIVRSKTIKSYLPSIDASYYNFNNQESKVCNFVKQQILNQWETTVKHTFQHLQWDIQQLGFPWHRMFEIDLDVVCLEALKNTPDHQ